MLTFDYYKNQYKGTLEESTFDELLPKVEACVNALIEQTVHYWMIHDEIISSLDVEKDLCIQLDYLAECGGIAAFNGQSTHNLMEIKTSNFTVNRNQKETMMIAGVPFHALAASHILLELRRKGFLNWGIE